ncbi:DUF6414 family protein [Amycolatopsis rubida]|uniref:Uncharacterized protein n=1 Tax=Amycolatopsis rubida TaxID=112413 RepID=A0A1I5E5R5_9PSEU|nr:hypothetical protein [Amycolatopsis rubida]SFO06834.1 hypothetical protein SAMN05421854_101511 [Amycolatopsis rubida]
MSEVVISNEHAPRGQFLRDYLYLDIEKVRSIAGQLEFGVPEEFRETDATMRKRSLGWEKFVSGSNESTEERYLQRSVVDSLFPELEAALEDGWLVDITEEFGAGVDKFSAIKSIRPEGSIFRLTAPGVLFDFEYFADTLSSFSAAAGGFEDFTKLMLADDGDSGDSLKRPSQKRPPKAVRIENSSRYRSIPADATAEDYIEEFEAADGTSPALFRSMARLTRGISRPGMTLIVESSADEDALVLAARFQQNRRYFDADSATVAARYGLSKQNWTIIGTIGHYTQSVEDVKLLNQLMNARGSVDSKGNFSRKYFIDTVSSLIQSFGAFGLSDIPQHPGISVIPIAVYRSFSRNP